MRKIDTSIYSAEKTSRIKPDSIDLSDLPPIVKPPHHSFHPAENSVPISPSFTSEQPSTIAERNSERSENRTLIRTEERTQFRSEKLPIKRRTKRYSFEFFDDQIVRLKKLKNHVEERGESVTLSDMVRDALDNYLTEQETRTE